MKLSKTTLRVGRLRKPEVVLFVDAREVVGLTNRKLAQQAHRAGHIRVLKNSKRVRTVYQPVKAPWAWADQTRTVSQPFVDKGTQRTLASKGTGYSTKGDGPFVLPGRNVFSYRSDSLPNRRFWGGSTLG